jgi:hypothetical protein
MAKPVKLGIFMEAGSVQGIVTFDTDLDVYVVDYDTEDDDGTNLTQVEFSDGTIETVRLARWDIRKPEGADQQFVAQLEERYQELPLWDEQNNGLDEEE